MDFFWNQHWQQGYKTKNIWNGGGKQLTIMSSFILLVSNQVLAGQGQLEQHRSHWKIAQGEGDVLRASTFYTSKVFDI